MIDLLCKFGRCSHVPDTEPQGEPVPWLESCSFICSIPFVNLIAPLWKVLDETVGGGDGPVCANLRIK